MHVRLHIYSRVGLLHALVLMVPASTTSRVMAIIRGSPRPNIAVASWKTNVLVGLAVAQVAVAQAHMNECYVGGVKLKDFKPLVWNRCVQRFVDTTLTICLHAKEKPGEKQSTPKQNLHAPATSNSQQLLIHSNN